MKIERKVIVGFWDDKVVQERIASWMRTAIGVIESSHIRVMRIADNMRNVAVTEGDKVEAQIKFGWEVDAYPVNEIAEAVKEVSKGDTDALVEEYYDKYEILLEGRDAAEFRKHVAVQAQIEIGFERFLEEKNYQAIVTHFGDLGSLQQLPGLAIQRLMEKGYGFGGEGDWKTAAMVRLMKIMTRAKKTQKVLPLWKTIRTIWFREKKVFWRRICWKFALPLQKALSALSASRFPWGTGKTRQDWSLLPRPEKVLQHPLLIWETDSV